MSKPKGTVWPATVLKAVEKMVEAIPSEQEVKDSTQAINSLIGFLERLRTILNEQPSQNVRQDVLKATTVLSAFLSSYSGKALLVEKPKTIRTSVNTEGGAELLFKELMIIYLTQGFLYGSL